MHKSLKTFLKDKETPLIYAIYFILGFYYAHFQLFHIIYLSYFYVILFSF